MDKLKLKYDRLIFEEFKISYSGLAVVRLLFASVSLLIIGYPNAIWLTEIPGFFYRPQLLNISHSLFPQIPSFWMLFLISWVPALLLVCILFGYKTRIAAITFGLLLIMQGALESSLGKIDHGIIHPLTAIIMSFSGWEKKLSIDSKKLSNTTFLPGFSIFMLAMIIGFAFFTAGAAKISGGWLDPNSLGVLHHLFGSINVWERQHFLASSILNIGSHYFWKLLDYCVILFECLFFFSIFRKKIFQYFIISAIVFHTMVLLILNITITSIFLAYAVFLPWQIILHELRTTIFFNKLQSYICFRNFLYSLGIVSCVYGGFILLTPRDVLLSLLNISLNPVSIDYRIFQTIIIYIFSWVVLIWIFKKRMSNRFQRISE